MEPNRSKGKSDYSLTNTSLGFLASKRITIKDRLWLFLGPTGILSTSCLPALVIHRHWNELVLLEAPFALEDTGSSAPVILLHEYLHFSPFAQLPFSQIYANCSRTEAFVQVQDELGKVKSRGEEIPAGWSLAAPVPWTFVEPGFHLGTLFFLANLNTLIDHG